MAKSLAITSEILDGVEQRTTRLLAGLEASDEGTIYKYNAQTGKSELFRRPPELPSARELLAQLLAEGRSPSDPFVVVAKEATVAELLVGQHAKGEENH